MKTVTRRVAFMAALFAAASATTNAQLNEGMVGFKAYRILFGSQAIGHVVVVGCDNANPPAGFAAGREYWTWSPGAAWRGSFTLVPVEAVPIYSAYHWTEFPHEHFDLSHAVPLPAILPRPGDRFYEVRVRDGSEWMPRGWMWLTDVPRLAQEWYGLDLASDLVGEGSAIRFDSVEPPAPNSAEVYLLVH
jgi:hypothetical protein